MVEITLQNLETELIQRSMQAPVLLDIWAPWCGPCKQLGPLLEKLETAYAGRFVLAKLDSDAQPEIAGQLSQAFGVRSIPFCVMFVGGQPVDGFVGALPEAQVRAFLDKHVPSPDELMAEEEAEEAEQLAAEGHTEAALEKLAEALAIAPHDEAIRTDYARRLLEAGRTAEARRVFEPLTTKATGDARVGALGLWLEACEAAADARPAATLDAAIAADKRDFSARFERAQVLVASRRFTEAMDELLEILMRDKAWGEQRPRKLYVAILELLTKAPPKPAAAEAKGTLELGGRVAAVAGDPVLESYRRKLSMVLF